MYLFVLKRTTYLRIVKIGEMLRRAVSTITTHILKSYASWLIFYNYTFRFEAGFWQQTSLLYLNKINLREYINQ